MVNNINIDGTTEAAFTTSDKTLTDSNTPPNANKAIVATMHVDSKQKRRNCVCKWGNFCKELQATLLQYCTDWKVNHVAFGLVRIIISVKNAPSNNYSWF